MSKQELDKTMPVSPPKVNKKIKPILHLKDKFIKKITLTLREQSQLKILMPVGMAIIIVAEEK